MESLPDRIGAPSALNLIKTNKKDDLVKNEINENLGILPNSCETSGSGTLPEFRERVGSAVVFSTQPTTPTRDTHSDPKGQMFLPEPGFVPEMEPTNTKTAKKFLLTFLLKLV